LTDDVEINLRKHISENVNQTTTSLKSDLGQQDPVARDLHGGKAHEKENHSEIITGDGGLALMLVLVDGAANLVDAEDYPVLSEFIWRRGGNGGGRTYVYRYEKRKKVYFHRFICDPSDGEQVDHIDDPGRGEGQAGEPVGGERARVPLHHEHPAEALQPRPPVL
jgi:hypothetical protein